MLTFIQDDTSPLDVAQDARLLDPLRSYFRLSRDLGCDGGIGSNDDVVFSEGLSGDVASSAVIYQISSARYSKGDADATHRRGS
jgi:hypothetical protein